MPAREFTAPKWRAPSVMGQEGLVHDIYRAGQMGLIFSIMRLVYRVDMRFLLGPSRGGKHLSLARQKMYYLAHCCYGISYTELGGLTQRDRTSISHGCQRIEDLRDDAGVDKSLFFIELALRMMTRSTLDQDNEAPSELKLLEKL